MKIGDRVYIERYELYGEVKEIVPANFMRDDVRVLLDKNIETGKLSLFPSYWLEVVKPDQIVEPKTQEEKDAEWDREMEALKRIKEFLDNVKD